MGIINRDKSNTERRETFEVNLLATATGVTGTVVSVPYPSSLDLIQVSAFGVSGAPTLQFFVNRFIPGTGATSFILGTTTAVVDYGTSGVISLTMGVSLPQIGSTLTQLQTNDVLVFQTGAANTAVKGMVIAAVLRPLVDIKRHFGIL